MAPRKSTAPAKKKPVSKRDAIIKAAKKRKRGVSVTVIAEEVNCSDSYVRMVLRDEGFAPKAGQGRREPIWSA